MTTAIYLADPYTISFASNSVTFTWGSGDYGPVTFEADSLEYNTNPNDATLLTVGSTCCEDSTTVRSSVATNGGGFATAALLEAYITANIIPAGTVVSITGGTGITVAPTPLTGTGTITHANFGTAGTYSVPITMTTNATGHVTAVTSGNAIMFYYAGSSLTPPAGTSYQPIMFDKVMFGSGYNTGTGQYRVPATGYYQATIQLSVIGMAGGGGNFYGLNIYRNSDVVAEIGGTPVTGVTTYIQISGVVFPATDGDTVEGSLYYSAGFDGATQYIRGASSFPFTVAYNYCGMSLRQIA